MKNPAILNTVRLYNQTDVRREKILEKLRRNVSYGATPEYVHETIKRFSPVGDKAISRVLIESFGESIFIRINGLTEAVVKGNDAQVAEGSRLHGDLIDLFMHEISYGRSPIPTVDPEVATALFAELWDKFTAHHRGRGFDPAWANGTGYFKVTALPSDSDYDSFCFKDNHGRRALVLWDNNSHSRVIVFERYTNGGMIAYNHSFGNVKGVSGAGAVHMTPYIFALMADYTNLATLNERGHLGDTKSDRGLLEYAERQTDQQ